MTMSRLEIKVSKDDLISQEGTSKGNQDKWFKDGLWVKSNALGYEDVAECLVSELLECSNLKEEEFVKYYPCVINNEGVLSDGCYSKDFLKKGESLLTFNRFFRESFVSISKIGKGMTAKDSFEFIDKCIRELTGVCISEYLANILILDVITLNEDRHLSNLAIIYDEDNNFRLCPIFDNGLSLLSDVSEYRYETPLSINMRNVRAKPLSSKFDKQIFEEHSTIKFYYDKVVKVLSKYELIEPRAVRIIQSSMKKYPQFFIKEDLEIKKLSSFK